MSRLTPSITTKSLPAPCIFVNFSFIRCAGRRNREGSIPSRLARRPGLETLVCPEVLLGHFAHAILDESVHAARVGRIVAAWEILPYRIAPQLVSGAARQHARHAGQHAGGGEPRHARKPGDRRGGGREERHENRIARPVVLVGEIVERNPLLERGERRAHAASLRAYRESSARDWSGTPCAARAQECTAASLGWSRAARGGKAAESAAPRRWRWRYGSTRLRALPAARGLNPRRHLVAVIAPHGLLGVTANQPPQTAVESPHRRLGRPRREHRFGDEAIGAPPGQTLGAAEPQPRPGPLGRSADQRHG